MKSDEVDLFRQLNSDDEIKRMAIDFGLTDKEIDEVFGLVKKKEKEMIEVFGYIMLTPNILANGTIQGEVVNYYASYEECFVDRLENLMHVL